MERRRWLLVAALLLLGAPNALADKYTDEVLRNRREQSLDERVYGESDRSFQERNLERQKEGRGAPPPSAPESPGWPPQR